MQRLIAVLSLLAMAACATQPPPAAAEPKMTAARWSAEDARADLATLYADLEASHYDLFAFRSRDEYDARYQAALASIRPEKTTLDLVRAFQPFAAFGRVGHARVEFPVQEYRAAAARGEWILPVDIRVDAAADAASSLVIAHNYSGDPRLAPGSVILSINGRAGASEYEAIAGYVSGETSYLVDAQLEEFFPRWYWVERGSVAQFTFVLARPDATTIEVRVPGMAIAQAERAKSTWTTELHSRTVQLLGDGLAYLRPGPFYETGGGNSMDVTKFAAFLEESFATILAAETRALLIDLRNNPGGDNSFSDPLVAWFATRPFRFSDDFRLKVSARTVAAWTPAGGATAPEGIVGEMLAAMQKHAPGETFRFDLPRVSPRPESERFRGRVFVLVNRHSYSNSASMAAMVQDYGFASIIGEETADVPTTYASSMQFTLPRTGLPVTYPKAFFVRPNGSLEVRGVVPDHLLATPMPGDEGADVLPRAITLVRSLMR